MKRNTDSGASRATASTELLSALGIYSRERGIDLDGLCAELGLDPELLSDGRRRVPISDFAKLWMGLARSSGDGDFGLHVALSSRKLQGQNSILFSILRNSATVGRAIENLVAYHDMSTNLIGLELERSGGMARLSWKMREAGSLAEDRHYSEGVMAILAFALSDLSEGRVAIAEARFRHPRPASAEEHERLFGRAPLFGAGRTELAFDEKSLSLPIPRANSELLELLASYAARLLGRLGAAGSCAAETMSRIGAMLARRERPSVDRVAEELGLSARSLQIKLKTEGCSYQAILDRMRKEIALDRLEGTRAPLSEIAFLLGFSEQSSFNRAFRRWTGLSPQKYLEAGRGRAGSAEAGAGLPAGARGDSPAADRFT